MHRTTSIVWAARSTLLALAATGSCGLALAQNASLDDLVLATVNGQNLTRGQLAQRLVDERGAESLEKLINRTLVQQAAARLKLTVTDAEVGRRLQELQNRFRTEADYQAFLTRSRLTEARLRDEVAGTALIQKIAVKELPIADEELTEYDVRIIEAPDKATAEKWIKEIMGGLNFLQAARERNADTNLKQAVGRLRPFIRIEMSDLARAVDEQKLAPGGFTMTPVQLPGNKWAILRLEGLIPIQRASALERERLTTTLVAHRVGRWMEAERARAKVELKPVTEPVVAIVNGEPVSRATLANWLLRYHGEETLQKAVNRMILLQAAARLGVTVSDAETDAKLTELKTQLKSPQAFLAFLTESNLTERQLRDETRHNIMLQRVAIKDNPIVDGDLTRYDIRMIELDSRQAAEAVIAELAKGGSFEKLAQQRTKNPQGRISGGRLKPFIRTEFLDIWRAMDEQKLQKGEHTKRPVLLTDNSFAVIKLEDVLPIAVATKEERERLTTMLTRYRIDQWLDAQRSAARITFPTDITTAIAAGG